MRPKLKPRRSVPVILQRDGSECLTTCLAMIFRYWGMTNVQDLLRELAQVDAQGTNLYLAAEVVQKFGFEAMGYHASWEGMQDLQAPFIAHYQGDHFIVVTRVGDDTITFIDPGSGEHELSKDRFHARWNGVVFTVDPTEDAFRNPDLLELIEERRGRKWGLLREFYLPPLLAARKVLAELLLATVVLQLLGLGLPVMTQGIIDRVLVDDDLRLLHAILLGLVLVYSTQLLLKYLRNVLMIQLKARYERSFFGAVMDRFVRLRQSYFDDHPKEDFINRLQEASSVSGILSPAVLESLLDILLVVAYSAFLFFYSPLLATVALAAVLVITIVSAVFTPRLRSLENKVFHSNVHAMGSFTETLYGINTVKILGIEQQRLWNWRHLFTRSLNSTMELETSTLRLGLLQSGLIVASQVSVYWIGAYLTVQGELTIGQYVAFTSIFMMVVSRAGSLGDLWLMLLGLSVTFERLNDLIGQEPEFRDVGSQRTTRPDGDLRIEGLSFRYSEKEADRVLDEVDLEVEAGTHLAIVGRNGSGKSTLAKLLLQLHPYEGNIFLGDTELRQYHPQLLRQSVVMLPQDIYIFHGTIRSNLQQVRPDASLEQLEQAMEDAELGDFLRRNFLGFNFVLSDGGRNLSSGQRLKLAFARLFLTDPEIILLDEATSVLDTESEQRITARLHERFPKATIITIAHRMSTVRGADRIVVLDDGRIVEDGTHEQLLSHDGIYASLTNAYLAHA
ncbi:MAG: peptidase domain-containing ABC transporter [Acidobacteriota bacterium]